MKETAALSFPLLLLASMVAPAAPPTFLEAAESAAKLLETEKRGDGMLGDAFQIVAIRRAAKEGDSVSWNVTLKEKSPNQPDRVSKVLDGKTYRLSIKVLQTGLAEHEGRGVAITRRRNRAEADCAARRRKMRERAAATAESHS